MKAGVEMVEVMHYKLRMFGLPIYCSVKVLCDNEAVYNKTITPESVLKKKHHPISYHKRREAVDAKTTRVAK